nr:hypothetical protein [Bacteroidota bacterium]
MLAFGCNQSIDIDPTNENKIIHNQIEDLSQFREELPRIVSEQDIEDCYKAAELARTIEGHKAELDCLIRLFQLQNKKENYRDALQTGNLALRLALDQGSKPKIAGIYKLFGKSYYHISFYHKCFENFENKNNYNIKLINLLFINNLSL